MLNDVIKSYDEFIICFFQNYNHSIPIYFSIYSKYNYNVQTLRVK
jgi:hypothetical protein